MKVVYTSLQNNNLNLIKKIKKIVINSDHNTPNHYFYINFYQKAK